MGTGDIWTQLSTAVTGLMLAWVMFERYCPTQLYRYAERCSHKLMSIVSPYISITFNEFTGDRFFKRSEAYTAIQNYLSANSSMNAKRLKADVVKNNQPLVLSMDDNEEVIDYFNGIKVWWAQNKAPKTQSISFFPAADDRRFYKLTFHRRDREIITKSYIDHVLKEGKAIGVKNRQRKLYTNNPSQNWYGWKSTKWGDVVFEHPATFDTLAMPTKMKEDIKKDLIKFRNGKDYYKKIGKPWKRGYLLYGPPGTGKSTMIAAMANLLDYDVYDLELTTVKDNSELRKLLIETTGKSIIVIEDIDCSLDLTGQRKKKEKDDKDEEEKEKDPISEKKKEAEEESKSASKVTLSGLLNFIDGIWSACGGERIIVFTTNYVDKLDPALIRKGRMDRHIEMTYCCFEAFKELAKNYLDIEWHELFAKIEHLLGETNMSPAEAVENLMPKSDDMDEETCLKNLIEALEASKEEARKKAEQEAKLKAEKEEKEKGKTSAKEVKENGITSAEEVKENGVTSANKVKENGVASAKEVKENGVITEG